MIPSHLILNQFGLVLTSYIDHQVTRVRVDKNRTFFSSKTPPTDEELAFQLNNAIKRDDMAFKIMMVAFGLLALFYLFAR